MKIKVTKEHINDTVRLGYTPMERAILDAAKTLGIIDVGVVPHADTGVVHVVILWGRDTPRQSHVVKSRSAAIAEENYDKGRLRKIFPYTFELDLKKAHELWKNIHSKTSQKTASRG